jgi:hypothetical protein
MAILYELLQFQNLRPLPSAAATGIVALFASLRRNDAA